MTLLIVTIVLSVRNCIAPINCVPHYPPGAVSGEGCEIWVDFE